MDQTTDTPEELTSKPVETVELDEVTVRFAGDSGDGMQLTGSQFTTTTALLGNDLSTLPDYPAEIRAPAGTLYGVSGFQLHFSSRDIHTHGDKPDTLVAMNPAALKVNIKDLREGATIIVNSDSFDAKNLKMAKYDANPLEDGSLKGYRVFDVPITKLTVTALEGIGLSMKEMTRSKNFFALGLLYWMYNRPMQPTLSWIQKKFKNRPLLAQGNEKALRAGYNYGEMTEVFTTRYEVKPAQLPKGRYRNLSGNEATALGITAASELAGIPGFLGSYPITPASEILQDLAGRKRYGFRMFQAEDEIAGICTAIGAAFGGSLAFTSTSGPGMALKQEAIGLAIITELPLVIVNVQRGGPSTGLPTKSEQADLWQAVMGRNGEAPLPVIAAQSPSDCFWKAIEAARIALKFMTPVILLTDGYIANGSEPFKIPDVKDLPDLRKPYATDPESFKPYSRDENLARPWAVPGTPGLEHRIGGLEKNHITGTVGYGGENHEFMVKMRAAKVARVADDIPDQTVFGPEDAELGILGWGSSHGSIRATVERMLEQGYSVAQVQLAYLNPFPKNLYDVLKKFKKILVPENNMGQLAYMLRATYFLDPIVFSKVQALPFKPSDIETEAKRILDAK